MGKLSDVVKNDYVKKSVYDQIAAKEHNFDTCDYILKTKDQTEKTKLEKKISDVSYFVKKPNSLN